MKRLLLTILFGILILTGCTQIPFTSDIKPTEQYILNTEYVGAVPVLFKDMAFNQLEDVDGLDRVILDSLILDLELQATGTIINDVNVTIYASTTAISPSDIWDDDSLKIATVSFTNEEKVVDVTLDSEKLSVLAEILEYINNGGRSFHIAILVIKDLVSNIEEAGIKITGGKIKGKFKIIK